ncbi:hypothetical protein NM688_g3899 [Phlebia brevispora]|uniref:Uncharacterized protein n=1 Tax=Phlebia brevispora TaxID=194682 RepID=A0ACC1T452_9APHY|nr:hypothetical protein NM688_g3899 [Phlebia brevispora]
MEPSYIDTSRSARISDSGPPGRMLEIKVDLEVPGRASPTAAASSLLNYEYISALSTVRKVIVVYIAAKQYCGTASRRAASVPVAIAACTYTVPCSVKWAYNSIHEYSICSLRDYSTICDMLTRAASIGATHKDDILPSSDFLFSPLDNIPGPPSTSFWRGNIPDMFNRHGWRFHDSWSQQYGQVFKFHGALGAKALYVFDPKALHSIIVKDQMIYEEARWFIGWNHMVHGPGLLSTLGEQHRNQRRVLNPVFSINHMRHMTPIFYATVHRLETAIFAELKGGVPDVDVLGWMGRLALELVGQGGLGYSFDPLVVNTHNAFGDAVKRLIPTTFALHTWRTLVPTLSKIGTPALQRAVARYLPNKDMQEMRHIIETLATKAREVYYSKKTALETGDEAVMHQVGEGKDILSVLIKANMSASEADRLSEEEVIAQMSTLIFAAMDTTSNALARTLHLLAEYQDVQDKMRAELLEASEYEDIPYDQLVALPYLDAVCRETLRLFPPVTFLFRETRQDAVMPLSQPVHGVDGSTINEILVPKDTSVVIGIRASNRNKEIWGEDALEWKPERWLSPLPEAVGQAHLPGVYSNLMTFLGGGRSCIGFKFSQLEMKVVLAVVLRSFKFSLSDKKIVWNLAGVNYPTVGETSPKPSLPLKVERVVR